MYFFAAIVAVAGLMPGALGLTLVIFLPWRHLIGFNVAWLLIAGTSMEMTLNDLIGHAAYGPAIATAKAVQLGLAALGVLRHGSCFDAFDPAWAYLAIFAAGLLHGLHPGLNVADGL